MRRARGFTFVEITLVVGLFVMLLTLAAPILFSFQTRAILDDAAEQIAQDLRRAQSLAIAGDGTSGPSNRDHGVFFDVVGERWVLFPGATYAEGAAENEEHTLSRSVDLVSVTLSGGGSSVVFRERTGRTASGGTMVLQGRGRASTITVNSAGRVTRD